MCLRWWDRLVSLMRLWGWLLRRMLMTLRMRRLGVRRRTRRVSLLLLVTLLMVLLVSLRVTLRVTLWVTLWMRCRQALTMGLGVDLW